MLKGSKHSKQTKEKMRESAFLRNNINRLKSLPKGDKHWNWNEEPSVLLLHRRIHRKYGKAKKYKCSNIDCNNKAHDWSCNGKYSDNIKDYEPLCRSCHVKKDKNWIKKN